MGRFFFPRSSLNRLSAARALEVKPSLSLSRYPSVDPPPDSSIPIQIASQHARLLYPGPHVTPMPYSTDLLRIKAALDVFAHRCIFCWVLQNEGPRPDHLLRSCSLSPNISTSHQRQWSSWRLRVDFPAGYCYGCGLPQHVRNLSFYLPPQLNI